MSFCESLSGRPSVRAAVHLLLALGLWSCSGTTPSTGLCESDVQCPLAGTRCDVEAGRCVCALDEACDPGFFCNNSGVCQVQSGCSSNAECRQDDTYCDLSTGQCLQGPSLVQGANCGLASHCPFGTVCEAGSCVAGCFDDGDCPLGVACIDGTCMEGLCSTDDFCEYAEECKGGQCKQDFRGPYCRGCTQRTGANPEPCDAPRNFCLVNNRELGGFTNFCGVDCSLGQECPNGFRCGGVLILTQDSCFNSAQCQCNPNQLRFASATCTVPVACDPRLPNGQPDPNATSCSVPGQADCNGGQEGGPNTCVVPRGLTEGNCTCSVDSECADDAVCTSGLCCGGTVRADRECVGGEGTVSGFCTCSTDDDCPRDNCDGSRGACAITDRPCTPGNNDCGAIPCVDGACLIGQNCAPEQGLTCSEVNGGG